MMYDPELKEAIISAVSRIGAEMGQKVPFMAERASAWMGELAGPAQLADYFLHPLAFPMLLLPWWVEKTCRAAPDLPFQSDLAYSTVNGYYYVRLIDNVMDGDVNIDLKLLPALNFFHSQFQAAYQSYFAAGHPFWNDFGKFWLRSGESAMQDASLPEIDQAQFTQIAAKKVCAAKIPVAAVCYRNDRPDLNQPWFRLVDLLGCWHQMLNDLFDWHKDLGHDAPTYFLSEAGRSKAVDESVAAWVVRKGFAWDSDTLGAWMAELKEMGGRLQSPDLWAYLEKREALFLDRQAEVTAGFENMARLLTALT
jgi:hypothetical protein